MKKKTRTYLYKRYKKIMWDDSPLDQQINVLAAWPDLKKCVEVYYKSHPGMSDENEDDQQPIIFKCTEKFMKSLNKYCVSRKRKLQFIDALAKIVYKIPSVGLYDKAIKERTNLWHFYVSRSWRVFYQKKEKFILLKDFGPHKKLAYYRK